MSAFAPQMGPLDLDRLVDAVRAVARPNPQLLAEIELSFLDTIAVASAGRASAIAKTLALIYGGMPGTPENAALMGAVAAHALDYDDVELESSAHVSAVVVPALLACVHLASAHQVAEGYLAGLHAARLLGRGLGIEHYAAGWHPTSTIGAVASAAAVARMLQLPAAKVRNALALSLCQASGMQKSFGTDAKPLQAGVASCAGVRAVFWANAGVSGPTAPFGERGFEALYGSGAPRVLDWDLAPAVNVARKPFPCCYGASRLISAGLELRRQLQSRQPARVEMTAQTATLLPLRTAPPRSGEEARFHAPYLIARAMMEGQLRLADFEGEAWRAADVQAYADKVCVREAGPVATSLEDGVVAAACFDADGSVIASASVAAFPGSPRSPLTRSEMDAKLLDCVGSADRVAKLRVKVSRYVHGPVERRSSAIAPAGCIPADGVP